MIFIPTYRKVLVCAPSNAAVMNICEVISKTGTSLLNCCMHATASLKYSGLNIIRVCAKASESHDSTSQKDQLSVPLIGLCIYHSFSK